MSSFVRTQLENSIEVKSNILEDQDLLDNIEAVGSLVVESYRKGGKMIFAGNGGSAADAQHLSAELAAC